MSQFPSCSILRDYYALLIVTYDRTRTRWTLHSNSTMIPSPVRRSLPSPPSLVLPRSVLSLRCLPFPSLQSTFLGYFYWFFNICISLHFSLNLILNPFDLLASSENAILCSFGPPLLYLHHHLDSVETLISMIRSGLSNQWKKSGLRCCEEVRDRRGT